MSAIRLCVEYAVHIRLNDEVIYIEFLNNTLSVYDLEADDYKIQDYDYCQGEQVHYFIDTETFSGGIILNLRTHDITISPLCDFWHYEVEEIAYQATI